MLFCMQVLKERQAQFADRIMKEFKASDDFRTFRSVTQREAAVGILDYLLDKGGALIRRNELKRVFIAGGRERFNRKQSQETDAKMIEGVLDHEMQRILDRLCAAGFVKRWERRPKSNRTKDRTKPDVFYSISPFLIKREDVNTDESMQELKKIDKLIEQHRAGPLVFTEVFRHNLLDMGFPNISDKDLEAFLQPFAKGYVHVDNDLVARWAAELPPEKARLKTQIIKYIQSGGHVSRRYDPIE